MRKMIVISASDFNKLEADAKAYQPIKKLSFLDTLTLQWNVNKAEIEEKRLSQWAMTLAKKEAELERRTRAVILWEDEVDTSYEAVKSVERNNKKDIDFIQKFRSQYLNWSSFKKWLFNLNGKGYESI